MSKKYWIFKSSNKQNKTKPFGSENNENHWGIYLGHLRPSHLSLWYSILQYVLLAPALGTHGHCVNGLGGAWLTAPLRKKTGKKQTTQTSDLKHLIYWSSSLVHRLTRAHSFVDRCRSSSAMTLFNSMIVSWGWTSTAGWDWGCTPPQWVHPSWHYDYPDRDYCSCDEASNWTQFAPISVCYRFLDSPVVWWESRPFCLLQ